MTVFGIDVGGHEGRGRRGLRAPRIGEQRRAPDRALERRGAARRASSRPCSELDGPGREARRDRHRDAVADRLRHRDDPVEREHPARAGFRCARSWARGWARRCFVDNDANCAALAEAHLVPDPPADVLVMLTLGTGVGGGIVIGGKIFRGTTGVGAELGHIVIDPHFEGDAQPGEFPRPGSLEWLCSGTGIEREATRRGSRGARQRARADSRRGRARDRPRGGRRRARGRCRGARAVRAPRPLAGDGHRERGQHLRARAGPDRGRGVHGGGVVSRRRPRGSHSAGPSPRSGSGPPWSSRAGVRGRAFSAPAYWPPTSSSSEAILRRPVTQQGVR